MAIGSNLLIFIKSAYLHCGINTQRINLSCGCFYLMAMIRILPASDEPPILEPLNATITNAKFVEC